MAAQSTKKRAQGGGRTPNSEPRVQVFRDFGGCDFQHAPHEFSLSADPDGEQADLQMNFTVLQNNVGIAANKTMETRNDLELLFTAPENRKYTGADILIADELYIGLDNGDLAYGKLGSGSTDDIVSLTSLTGEGHHWRSFCHVDDKLAGTTAENELWTGSLGSHSASNTRHVPEPDELSLANLTPVGMTISAETTPECRYRVKIAHTWVNKYGPTMMSEPYEFYAQYPPNEWHGQRYIGIDIAVPDSFCEGYAIVAAEFYFSVGDSTEYLFFGRSEVSEAEHDDDLSASHLRINWTGYYGITDLVTVANLVPPESNYTEGPRASRLACIDGKMYFWGCDGEPQRLYIGGNPGNLFSTAPSTGGGFIDVEPGTGQEIRCVMKYKTQSGNSIVTLMCDSPNSSKEQRYNLVEQQVSLSSESAMKSWQAEQVAGSVGCKSFNGAKVCEDGLYSVSRYGLALTTMTMEYNSQIRTNYVSDQIKPVFLGELGTILDDSVLLECDGVLYLAVGRGDATIDNLLFCYDIDLKAWWTISLDIDEPILNMLQIDYEGFREGIGIVTPKHVYLLPTTLSDDIETQPDFDFIIQTAQISTAQPQQGWQYLSQLEFRFDYFIGQADIELTGFDQFGRKMVVRKRISHGKTAYDLAEFMRVDLRLQSYSIRITGHARFRLTHFMAKLYVMSSKQGLVWGFDDSASFRSSGDTHPTYACYNDIRKAIIV